MSHVKNVESRLAAQDTKRLCNICNEPIMNSKNSLYTNRDAGYGIIGKAHDTCIASRLNETE
jgi:hypothetical protein